ncbi:Ribonuclease H domain [Arabidopsis suecica]|uniref:Ribonuclease H domain n=1 Tax=Arabidopsis suecica TaxID=45249 RepID=A0A8T1YH90_ARASU|nr:Ribonuclease H domain [Arabidopsis suecica]
MKKNEWVWCGVSSHPLLESNCVPLVLEVEEDKGNSGGNKVKGWSHPVDGWLKCNIALVWSTRNKIGGGAWVVRNDEGKVLVHSRKVFCGSNNKKEAMLMCLIWALESLLSLKMDKIIFAAEAHDIFGAIGRPKAWPSLTQQVVEINQFLDKFKDWRLEVESVNSNRGTSLIAKSVISDGRFHDYIASGHPSWLHRVFEDERLASFAQ